MTEDLEIEPNELNLIDEVLSRFTSTKDFTIADFTFETDDFFKFIWQFCPIRITKDRFHELMIHACFEQSFNELNNKFYWLLIRKDV